MDGLLPSIVLHAYKSKNYSTSTHLTAEKKLVRIAPLGY